MKALAQLYSIPGYARHSYVGKSLVESPRTGAHVVWRLQVLPGLLPPIIRTVRLLLYFACYYTVALEQHDNGSESRFSIETRS